MIPVPLLLASEDRRLRRDEYRVLIYLYSILSPYQFRKVKQMSLGRAVRLNKQDTSRAVTQLMRCDYIQRGGKEDGVYTYRLNTPVVPGATSSAA